MTKIIDSLNSGFDTGVSYNRKGNILIVRIPFRSLPEASRFHTIFL